MDNTVIIYGQNNGHEMASVFQFDHFLNLNNPPNNHLIISIVHPICSTSWNGN